PFRLKRGEVWHAYHYLSSHAHLVRLGPWRALAEGNTEGCFQLKYGSLEKPAKYTAINNIEQHLLLETKPLNIQVNNDLKKILAGETVELTGCSPQPAPQQIEHMLKKMLLAWHISPQRRHERKEKYDWLISVIGVPGIHSYLKQQLNPDETSPCTEETDQEESYELSSQASTVSFNQTYETYRWRQVNLCASGSGIEVPADQIKHIRVGDLVLINQDADSVHLWHLAIIKRLMRHPKSNQMELGAQFVPGAVITATLSAMTKPGSAYPTLLVKRSENHNDMLFTPAKIYQQGHQYTLTPDIDQPINMQAGKLLDSTSSYDCFEILPLNS
ncbi:MAG: hypothetical protein MI754_09740, partial [Chromatiales bacterium]|nr:hypothetical protein [Chromatiales bacterium]